ncbi:MAG: TonB-dependent receptor [Pseudomonadota bacterium]
MHTTLNSTSRVADTLVRKMSHAAISVAIMASLCTGAAAQDGNRIEEIVVTASRLPKDLGSVPHSVTILTAEQIAEQGKLTTDLGAMLASTVPGLVASSVSASNFAQTLRGRKPAVLIDGVLIGTPLRDAGRELRTITPAAVGSVEVIRGATAIYGNGGAGGTINYLTKAPVEGELEASVTFGLGGSLTEYDDSESYYAEFFVSAKPGNFDYVLTGSFDDVGVFFDADGDPIAPDPGNQGGIADTETTNLFAKLGYDIGTDQRVAISAVSYSAEQSFDWRQDITNPGDRGLLDSSQREKQVATRVDAQYLSGIVDSIQAGYDELAPGFLFAYPDALGSEIDNRIDPITTDNTVLTLTYQHNQLFGNTSFLATAYAQEVENVFGWSTFFAERVDPIVAAEDAGLIDAGTAAFLQQTNADFNGIANAGPFGKHNFFEPSTLVQLAGGTGIEDTYQYIRGGQSRTESEKSGLRADFKTPIENILSGGQLLWGVDYARDDTQQLLTDGRVFTPPMDLTSVGYFAQLELALWDAFTLRTGVRYEDATVDIDNYTSFLTGQAITGADLDYDETLLNVGGVYNITEDIAVFAGYSEGFIVSDIGRLIRFIDVDLGTGLPTGLTDVSELNPEAQVIENYEIGLRGNHESFDWSIAVYQSESENGTTLDPITLEAVRAPEEIWGYEVLFDYRISETLGIGATYSYVEGDADFDNDGDFETPLNATRISPPKLTAYVDWNFLPKWSGRAQALYSESEDFFDDVPLEQRADAELPFDSYLLVDLIVSGEIGPGILNLGLQNALNEDYFTLESQQFLSGFFQAAGPGRSFMLKYTYQF